MVSHPRETCETYVRSVRERIGASGADIVVKVGYPHESILETASDVGASLIVASTHGRAGFSRWMYGSTVGHLLRGSHTPLLIVGKNVLSFDTRYEPKHVLMPLDGSTLAEGAIPIGFEVAEAFKAKTSLVRVAPFSVEAYPMMVPQMYWPELDKELVAGAQTYLEDVRRKAGKPADLHVLQGPRADTLLTFIERDQIDLVVMSTHARAGVPRAILGSNADRMLEGPAPVLLVRPER